jgi:hypothetical protein
MSIDGHARTDQPPSWIAESDLPASWHTFYANVNPILTITFIEDLHPG